LTAGPILVTGGTGQLARSLETQGAGMGLLRIGRPVLDFDDLDGIPATLEALAPRMIINAAAYTAVDRAESEPEAADRANHLGPKLLAEFSAAHGIPLIHISTDYVFDGSKGAAYLETDTPNPASVYGASKLAGERQVNGSGIVLRTSWVYASTGKNFVLTMLRLMREKPQLAVVCDQIGTPTWATSIGRAIWGLIDADAAPGIYHWTDLGVASWYDFAVAIQDEAYALGLLESRVPVTPISSRQYPTKATRPAFSVLDTAATRAAIAAPADHWRHNLRKMLDELRAP
jgi:dTDP-4-dehydrorhamnose reductase